jgi:hypothetical protein
MQDIIAPEILNDSADKAKWDAITQLADAKKNGYFPLENAEGSKGPTVETTNCEDHIADYINDSIDEALERSSKKKASLRAEDEVEKKAGEINICIRINICSTRPRHC